MAELTTDTETDQLIWSIIQKSINTNDHIAFIRQAMDRDIPMKVLLI